MFFNEPLGVKCCFPSPAPPYAQTKSTLLFKHYTRIIVVIITIIIIISIIQDRHYVASTSRDSTGCLECRRPTTSRLAM